MLKPALAAFAMAAALTVTPAIAACDTIKSRNVGLSACIDDAEWELRAPQGDQEFLFFSLDQRVGFTVITEQASFTASDFRRAVLVNGMNANGGKEVQVVSERVESVGGRSWNVIEYQLGEPGEELEFQNFYYSQPDFGAVQVVFWSTPGDATLAAYRAGVVLSSVGY